MYCPCHGWTNPTSCRDEGRKTAQGKIWKARDKRKAEPRLGLFFLLCPSGQGPYRAFQERRILSGNGKTFDAYSWDDMGRADRESGYTRSSLAIQHILIFGHHSCMWMGLGFWLAMRCRMILSRIELASSGQKWPENLRIDEAGLLGRVTTVQNGPLG